MLLNEFSVAEWILGSRQRGVDEKELWLGREVGGDARGSERRATCKGPRAH